MPAAHTQYNLPTPPGCMYEFIRGQMSPRLSRVVLVLHSVNLTIIRYQHLVEETFVLTARSTDVYSDKQPPPLSPGCGFPGFPHRSHKNEN